MGRRKIWWERRSTIMKKSDCWRSLITLPHPSRPPAAVRIAFFLTKLIIYHKVDIIKSVWINPWYCIQIRIKMNLQNVLMNISCPLCLFFTKVTRTSSMVSPVFLNTNMVNLYLLAKWNAIKWTYSSVHVYCD